MKINDIAVILIFAGILLLSSAAWLWWGSAAGLAVAGGLILLTGIAVLIGGIDPPDKDP